MDECLGIPDRLCIDYMPNNNNHGKMPNMNLSNIDSNIGPLNYVF